MQIVSLIFLGWDQSPVLVIYNPLFFMTISFFLAFLGKFLQSMRFKALFSKISFLKKRKSKFNHSSFTQKRSRLFYMLIITLPISWMCFYQPMFILMPPIMPNSYDVKYIQNSYEDLTFTQKTLFDEFLEDQLPSGSNLSTYLNDDLSTRTAIRVASGLLFRNWDGDVENSTQIIKWVLNLQETSTSKRLYGTWKTSPKNDRGDENWREFIGCELILLLERHEDKLSSEIVSNIEDSLIHAAKGASDRNVEATYTNIAVMSSFLMAYVGQNLRKPHIEEVGMLKAWQIYILFNRHETFSEYNSPTYDGVTMVGLALWRDLGPCEEMKAMGAEMEIILWESISKHYHPGFKNIVGPFFRGYGMDMTKYNAIIGMWITLAINDLNDAPLPRKNGTSYFELSNIFPAVQLGHASIDSVIERLNCFEKSRFLERKVPSSLDFVSKEYKITMWLDEDRMMGGVEGLHTYYKSTEQIKVGTLYWNSSVNETLAWLMVPSLNAQDVKVSEAEMKIWREDGEDRVIFFVNGKDFELSDFKEKKWDLPGIRITSSIDPDLLKVSIVDSEEFSSDFAIRDSLDTVIKVQVETSEIELTIS